MIPRTITTVLALCFAHPASATPANAIESLLNHSTMGPSALAKMQMLAKDDYYKVCLQKAKQYTAEGRKHNLTDDFCRCVSNNVNLSKDDFIALSKNQAPTSPGSNMGNAISICNKNFGIAPK
ncbi:MAG: hypothetical protein J0M34_00010 [Alphaproteobacteria bacterium]|nr:hypothetical protein [Alphaproteobacteria bacterium]